MAIYKDFLGLNICIYDPCELDTGSFGTSQNVDGTYNASNPNSLDDASYSSNTLGYRDGVPGGYWYTSSIGDPNVGPLTNPSPPQVLTLLNYHRNGPYGYPTWKQVRSSDNHLIRAQKRKNVFTFVSEPGRKHRVRIKGGDESRIDRFGKINRFIESPVIDSFKPLTLIGGTSYVNSKTNLKETRTTSINSSFGNEMVYFANDKINSYYNLENETCEEYESLKDLYLDNALNDVASPITRFDMLIYRQTVFPKMNHTFLEKTRTRMYFNYKYKSTRADRTVIYPLQTSKNIFGTWVPSSSVWPLDAEQDFTSRPTPTITKYFYSPSAQVGLDTGSFYIGGAGWVNPVPPAAYPQLKILMQNKSKGAAGVLQNTYNKFFRGAFRSASTTAPHPGDDSMYPVIPMISEVVNVPSMLTAACHYHRLNTLKSIYSFTSPDGMDLAEIKGALDYLGGPGARWWEIPTASLFLGNAYWDAPSQAGKSPFYDSYLDYASEIRLKGKSYSIIPEFRISSHVETYAKKGVTEELKSIFELSGATSVFTTTSGSKDFYTILSNSDFLKHFELVTKDHRDFTSPKAITLRCKAIKKFLPYEGFYPAERTSDIAAQFARTYGDYIGVSAVGRISSKKRTNQELGKQAFMNTLFAPGVLFNSIKGGIACDWPVLPADSSRAVFCNPSGYGDNARNWDSSYSVLAYDRPPPPNFPGQPYSSPNNSANKHVVKQNVLIRSSSTSFRDSHPAGAYGEQRSNLYPVFSQRIPFEALANPEFYLNGVILGMGEPHPFGFGLHTGNNLEPYGSSREIYLTSSISAHWGVGGDNFYNKMANNFLAEVPEFFLRDKQFTTIASLESQDSSFGNAESGSFYVMRIKMYKTLDGYSDTLRGFAGCKTTPPQTVYPRTEARENFTMYSRPSAFGPPSWGSGGTGSYGNSPVTGTNDGYAAGVQQYTFSGSDSLWGYNFPYTPPYYHGQGWCDLIFECTASKKYDVQEIINNAKEFPYYTRFWWNGTMDTLRDLTGYRLDGDKLNNVTASNIGSLPSYGTANKGVGISSSGSYFGAGRRFMVGAWATKNWNLQSARSLDINKKEDLALSYKGTYDTREMKGPHKRYKDSPWATLINRYSNLRNISAYCTSLGNFAGEGVGAYEANWANPTVTIPAGAIGGFPKSQGWAGFPMSSSDPGMRFTISGSFANWGNQYYTDGFHAASGAWAGCPIWNMDNYSSASEAEISPQHPYYLNNNAMQMNASFNLFGQGVVRTINTEGDSQTVIEVSSPDAEAGKTRWIIQPKFETPMLNFNKYNDLKKTNCTSPSFASESVPRGMWHQYGEIPEPGQGIYLQVSDIPPSWFLGSMGITNGMYKRKIRSLADLVGFPKDPIRLGETAEFKEISEAVVAVPFMEEQGDRKFFSIPRIDIKDCIESLKREVAPNVFLEGKGPSTGRTVYEMVRKMQKYVFPPSMDFVKYDVIQPFAMYIFEFKHNLSKQDLVDIWQNLSPTIGTSFEESETSITHELLAHELLGQGAQFNEGELDVNAEGKGIPSKIRWMMFKVKKKAKVNYFEQVVASKGTTRDLSKFKLEGVSLGELGQDEGITYNWPYDFFSLVELVKLDAEVIFTNIENDNRGQKVIKAVEELPPEEKEKILKETDEELEALGAPAAGRSRKDMTRRERRQDRRRQRRERRKARKQLKGAEKRAQRKEDRQARRSLRKGDRELRKQGY